MNGLAININSISTGLGSMLKDFSRAVNYKFSPEDIKSKYKSAEYYRFKFLNYLNGKEYIDEIKTLKNFNSNSANCFFSTNASNEISHYDKTKVISLFGKPNYKFRDSSNLQMTIYYYKTNIEGLKMNIEFHFFNDKLYYQKLTFPYLMFSSRKKVFDIINEKYGTSFDKLSGKVLIKIKESNNYVIIKNVFNLSISTLDFNNSFYSKLLNNTNDKSLLIK